MAATRAFYVIQGSLEVRGLDGAVVDTDLVFPDSDAGLLAFDEYLAGSEVEPSLVVVDVIEEVFVADTIPKLGSRDRTALLDRRIKRKFPRTPYRLSVIGGAVSGSAEKAVVHSSISNHELLDPWISVIMRHRVPLIGIFSVPLMATQIVKPFYRKSNPVLFITQHQGNKLRQSFIKNGLVMSGRLSQSPATSDAAYAAFVNTEILRSRRYLERSRLLSSMEPLDICMVAEKQLAEQIVNLAESVSPLKFHFADPAVAKKRTRVATTTPDNHLEAIYVTAALRHRPKHSYAASGEQRYWQMSRIRRSFIAAAFAAGAACSVVAGINIGDAWRLHRETNAIDAQVTQLSETFRRENESFGPIKADSYEMKLAVDTGDYILRQRVPVPWVLQQLGYVLADYTDVRVAEIAWQAEIESTAEPVRAQPGEPAVPVPIPGTSAVSAEIVATIEPFDGDLRAAFRRIDQLVDDIATRTSFSEAAAVEYPIDASLGSSITGELGREGGKNTAQFRLRLTYPLTTTAMTGGESDDESF